MRINPSGIYISKEIVFVFSNVVIVWRLYVVIFDSFEYGIKHFLIQTSIKGLMHAHRKLSFKDFVIQRFLSDILGVSKKF